MEEIRHVTVQDMLKARDERVMRQQRLLQHHQISYRKVYKKLKAVLNRF